MVLPNGFTDRKVYIVRVPNHIMETQTEFKSFSEARQERAKALLEQGNLECLDENTYLVPSQTDSNKKYIVNHFDSFSCNCPDFELRCKGKGLYCKHIKAILLLEKFKAKYEIEGTGLNKEVEMIVEFLEQDICPNCQSKELIKRGIRKTRKGTLNNM